MLGRGRADADEGAIDVPAITVAGECRFWDAVKLVRVVALRTERVSITRLQQEPKRQPQRLEHGRCVLPRITGAELVAVAARAGRPFGVSVFALLVGCRRLWRLWRL